MYITEKVRGVYYLPAHRPLRKTYLKQWLEDVTDVLETQFGHEGRSISRRDLLDKVVEYISLRKSDAGEIVLDINVSDTKEVRICCEPEFAPYAGAAAMYFEEKTGIEPYVIINKKR